jgi:Ca2+-binding EF-hand superfamily protein
MEIKNDPKNYSIMSMTYKTEEELKLAFQAFDKDLQKLRKKHRIAEILIVKQAYLEDGSMTSMGTYGSELSVLPMANLAITKAIELNAELLDKMFKAITNASPEAVRGEK